MSEKNILHFAMVENYVNKDRVGGAHGVQRIGKAGLLATSLVLSLCFVGCTARALLPAELRPDSLSDLKEQAEAGDMEAQHELGRMYK